MKKWFKITRSGISVYIQLTDKEAALVNYVANSSNWKSCISGGWCGAFILIPATKEEIDECGLTY